MVHRCHYFKGLRGVDRLASAVEILPVRRCLRPARALVTAVSVAAAGAKAAARLGVYGRLHRVIIGLQNVHFGAHAALPTGSNVLSHVAVIAAPGRRVFHGDQIYARQPQSTFDKSIVNLSGVVIMLLRTYL
jgi:hypothetical protein